MNLWIGCAVWAYRGWVPDFYPPGTRPADYLRRYVERLTAVEGNTTFYALPSAEQVSAWAQVMPEGFHFCPKLSRRVTHEGKLADGEHLTRTFIDRMRGFGDNLGPILVQLPPSYGPPQFADLQRFLRWWPHDEVELALEVRHPGWWLDAPSRGLNELLAELGAARVLLDTRAIYDGDDDPQLDAERKKPEVPLEPILTSSFTMVRYIGHPTAARNDAYLDQWADQLTDWLREGARVYYFSHCPIEERSPGYARALQRRLEARGADAPPLPWDDIPPPPKQLGLF